MIPTHLARIVCSGRLVPIILTRKDFMVVRPRTGYGRPVLSLGGPFARDDKRFKVLPKISTVRPP